MANQAKAQPCPPAALIRRPWVPGAGCLREPPRLREEAKADGRDLSGTVETAVGDAHGKGGGDGPAHMGTATSCWPLRGWASDPTARGPGGPARSGCPGPSTSARRPQCPDARGPASSPSMPGAKPAVPAESCKDPGRSCSGFWIYVRGRRCGIRNGVFQNNFPCLAEKRFVLFCFPVHFFPDSFKGTLHF